MIYTPPPYSGAIEGEKSDFKRLRLARGFTQLQLAQMCGCSIASIKLFDGGYQPPASHVMRRALAVLNDPAARPAGPLAVAMQDPDRVNGA